MSDDPNTDPDVARYVARYAVRIAKWPQIDAFNLLHEDIYEERAARELLVNAFKEAARRVLAAEKLSEREEFERKLSALSRCRPIKVLQSPVVVPFPKKRKRKGKDKPHLRIVGDY